METSFKKEGDVKEISLKAYIVLNFKYSALALRGIPMAMNPHILQSKEPMFFYTI